MKTSPIFNTKQYIKIVLLTSIWVHAAEVFRYFILVIPRVKKYWNHIEHVADMNWGIFAIWGVWDTILTGMSVFLYGLYAQVYGHNKRSVIISATLSWIFFFVLYWVGTANMGYSDWNILWITLPLSWLEMIIASYIAFKLYSKNI